MVTIRNSVLLIGFGVCFVAVLVTARPKSSEEVVQIVGEEPFQPADIAAPLLSREKMCRLPAVRGHCRALLPRWRYDPKTQQCHEFKFGGCDGNGNNFYTESDCMIACKGV